MVDQEKVTRIYIRLCVECTEYFIFNGKGGRLQFDVTPF